MRVFYPFWFFLNLFFFRLSEGLTDFFFFFLSFLSFFHSQERLRVFFSLISQDTTEDGVEAGADGEHPA